MFSQGILWQRLELFIFEKDVQIKGAAAKSWLLNGSICRVALGLLFFPYLILIPQVILLCFLYFQAVIVYECLSEWGQILCAICPNPKLVITGGTSTAVCVWEMGISKEKAKALTLKQVKYSKDVN